MRLWPWDSREQVPPLAVDSSSLPPPHSVLIYLTCFCFSPSYGLERLGMEEHRQEAAGDWMSCCGVRGQNALRAVFFWYKQLHLCKRYKDNRFLFFFLPKLRFD